MSIARTDGSPLQGHVQPPSAGRRHFLLMIKLVTKCAHPRKLLDLEKVPKYYEDELEQAK
ncbi:hypothetical protein H0H92_004601 [Tricholoma furcatifolium]|nr:hypothetical protein H0H92_004601 [Tricholoma furcatifolium]